MSSKTSYRCDTCKKKIDPADLCWNRIYQEIGEYSFYLGSPDKQAAFHYHPGKCVLPALKSEEAGLES